MWTDGSALLGAHLALASFANDLGMVLTTSKCQTSLISLTMLEHSMKYLLVFFKLLAGIARWHLKHPVLIAGGTRGTKNVAGNSSVSSVFGAILPLPNSRAGLGAPAGCAGEERTGRLLLSPGYECGLEEALQPSGLA